MVGMASFAEGECIHGLQENVITGGIAPAIQLGAGSWWVLYSVLFHDILVAKARTGTIRTRTVGAARRRAAFRRAATETRCVLIGRVLVNGDLVRGEIGSDLIGSVLVNGALVGLIDEGLKGVAIMSVRVELPKATAVDESSPEA